METLVLEEAMSAADLSPADWLAIQNAVSNDASLEDGQRMRLVDRLGDFHASALEFSKPHYYACGICDHYHPSGYTGDCRDDRYRFADPSDTHGALGWVEDEQR